jgi:D-galactarolactone isomerase
MERPVSGRTPRLVAPEGACDTHMHFYDSAYAGAPGVPAPPADARVPEYRKLQKWLGLGRVVVVQPNAYGTDNRCTLDAVAQLGAAARCIVVVRPDIGEAELQRLTDAGARGVRIFQLPGGTLKLDVLHEIAARVRPFGWHPIIQLDGRELPEHEATLRRIEGDFVIDHIGKFLVPVTEDDAAFKVLLRLVERGNCYVKLSAPYETSRSGPPDYADVGRLARRLARAAPERMLWASNWPHPSASPQNYPNDADLLDLLLDWVPDEAARRKILVENPARLYGF